MGGGALQFSGPQFPPLWSRAGLLESTLDGDLFGSLAVQVCFPPGLCGEVNVGHVKEAQREAEVPWSIQGLSKPG